MNGNHVESRDTSCYINGQFSRLQASSNRTGHKMVSVSNMTQALGFNPPFICTIRCLSLYSHIRVASPTNSINPVNIFFHTFVGYLNFSERRVAIPASPVKMAVRVSGHSPSVFTVNYVTEALLI